MSRLQVMLIAGLALGALAAAGRLDAHPKLVWNATSSAPEGLYRIDARGAVEPGSLVAVRPEPALATWLDARGYVPKGVLLIKQVGAVHPTRVCRRDAAVVLGRSQTAPLRDRDRMGRVLPSWSGCRPLTDGEIFLINPAEGSLDSRYFGPVNRRAVIGSAVLIWRWGRA